MGRLSQFFWYLNKEEHPTALERAIVFTHLDITEELKAIRRGYRKEIREDNIKIDTG